MKVFGFDDTCVARGDLLAAEVNKRDLDWMGETAAAHSLMWACCTTFKKAKAQLITRMKAERVDPELIELVQTCRASHVPVVEAYL
ncbi:MAG: hypothetical protein DHS20C12_11630 [Pseudohongiella sp.]|nr:MAG: hypothetical protein DHS20C12_11630 [Pseudohongiella sp.]